MSDQELKEAFKRIEAQIDSHGWVCLVYTISTMALMGALFLIARAYWK